MMMTDRYFCTIREDDHLKTGGRERTASGDGDGDSRLVEEGPREYAPVMATVLRPQAHVVVVPLAVAKVYAQTGVALSGVQRATCPIDIG
jgi:hypothetical protein